MKKEEIERLCPHLTDDELEGVAFAIWPRSPHAQVIKINYTFDIDSIPSDLEKNIQNNHPNVTMSVEREDFYQECSYFSKIT